MMSLKFCSVVFIQFGYADDVTLIALSALSLKVFAVFENGKEISNGSHSSEVGSYDV